MFCVLVASEQDLATLHQAQLQKHGKSFCSLTRLSRHASSVTQFVAKVKIPVFRTCFREQCYGHVYCVSSSMLLCHLWHVREQKEMNLPMLILQVC